MLKKWMRSPRTVMALFVVLVNTLAGIITALVWIPLTGGLSFAGARPYTALVPMVITILLAVLISAFFGKRTAKPLQG